jgi:thioredoxin-like negative regulator of GroEL
MHGMTAENFLTTITEADNVLLKETVVLFYFSTTSCNVGEAFEPKVVELIKTTYPKIKFFKIDLNFSPELAAKHNAFVEPTIVIFFDGKETIRKSRTIGIYELETAIKRPYELIFN